MRILFVSCEPPDAPLIGSIIQTYHFMVRLSSEHCVGLVSMAGEAVREQKLREMYPYCRFIPRRPVRRIADRARWLVGGDPMARWGFAGDRILPEVEAGIAEFRPDLVQFEQIQVAHPLLSLCKRSTRPRLAFNAHDAVHVILKRAHRTGSAGYCDRRFAAVVEDFEHRLVAAADLALCVSEVDAGHLRMRQLAKQWAITPNGVDIDFYTPTAPPPAPPATLVYVGNLVYGPNADAIRWYAREIHPQLRRQRPELKLLVVGPSDSAMDDCRSVPGIEFVGLQRDPRPFVQQAQVVAVPLRSGSGTRFKILEAWAAGRPVVSTSIGAEGLPYQHEQNILIADDAAGFAEAVVRLLDDPPLCARLARQGRCVVERQFSWPAIVEELKLSYRRIL